MTRNRPGFVQVTRFAVYGGTAAFLVTMAAYVGYGLAALHADLLPWIAYGLLLVVVCGGLKHLWQEWRD